MPYGIIADGDQPNNDRTQQTPPRGKKPQRCKSPVAVVRGSNNETKLGAAELTSVNGNPNGHQLVAAAVPVDHIEATTDANVSTADADALYDDWILTPEQLNAAGRAELQSRRRGDERIDQIADYFELGWSIVPQLPGEKSPCVKWKTYQTERSSAHQLCRWFDRWPDAGPTVVLGPLSNLFAIDVDGKEAHEELVRRLGNVPAAPTVKSGSGKPYRYHLYFLHPSVPTKAKATPWHPKLEFRGHRGIVVLPPSLHKSGNRYQWAPGKSLSDISLSPLPELIIAAISEPIRKKSVHAAIEPAKRLRVSVVPGICRSTHKFLGGTFANQNDWNTRLFRAVCDMAGNGVPLEKALPLLVAGAQPWNAEEEARAVTTIHSAYSQPRVPARLYRTM